MRNAIYWMWHRVRLVRGEVSEENVASIFRVERISELIAMLVLTNRLNLVLIADIVPASLILSTRTVQVTPSFESSVLTRHTRRHIPEEGIHHQNKLHLTNTAQDRLGRHSSRTSAVDQL
jgi:hypothetical protein